MGMYDYLKCEYLIMPEDQGRNFQTKSLRLWNEEFGFQTVIFTKEGRLVWKRQHWEWDGVTRQEKPIGGFFPAEYEVLWERDEELSFSGRLDFGNGDIRYEALFWDGQMLCLRKYSPGVPETLIEHIREKPAALAAQLADAKLDLAEYEALFMLQHKASMEASRVWQKATGHTCWPDLHELLVWLLDRKGK